MKRDLSWAMDNNLNILNREDLTDESLDDCLETVKIGQLEYSPSDVLKSVDPVAYRCEVNDYIDSRLSDGDITELDDGTLVYTYEIESMEQEAI